MKREDAIPYISWIVDNAGSAEKPENLPAHLAEIKPTDTLVGWQCGFEPLFVAVRSYLQDTDGISDVIPFPEAEDIAKEWLLERNWFSNPDADNNCDHVFEGTK